VAFSENIYCSLEFAGLMPFELEMIAKRRQKSEHLWGLDSWGLTR
jgi:hypothetical protein